MIPTEGAPHIFISGILQHLHHSCAQHALEHIIAILLQLLCTRECIISTELKTNTMKTSLMRGSGGLFFPSIPVLISFGNQSLNLLLDLYRNCSNNTVVPLTTFFKKGRYPSTKVGALNTAVMMSIPPVHCFLAKWLETRVTFCSLISV